MLSQKTLLKILKIEREREIDLKSLDNREEKESFFEMETLVNIQCETDKKQHNFINIARGTTDPGIASIT